jgi:hypothetical protein
LLAGRESPGVLKSNHISRSVSMEVMAEPASEVVKLLRPCKSAMHLCVDRSVKGDLFSQIPLQLPHVRTQFIKKNTVDYVDCVSSLITHELSLVASFPAKLNGAWTACNEPRTGVSLRKAIGSARSVMFTGHS